MDARTNAPDYPVENVDAPTESSCCSGTMPVGLDGPCCGSGATTTRPTTRSEPGDRIFRVQGLDCAEEVAILRRAVGSLVGGDDLLGFDVLNGRMILPATTEQVSDAEIRAAVAATGMRAEVWRPESEKEGAVDARRQRQMRATALSGAGLAIGIVLHIGLPDVAQAAIAAYVAAILFGIRFVLPKAWYAARVLRPDMNLLMVIAVAGAALLGEWLEAATVSFLFALSLALESWSVGRARRAVSALLDLAPPSVRVRDQAGRETSVPATEVAVGTRFIVRPGERIPLDGTVAAGAGSVDQAPITGESIPVPKELGDDIFAGTINGEGVLEADSTKAANDTTLARIIRMVQDAHSRKARSEQWVDRFARVYTPAVIALAAVVMTVPPLFAGGSWTDWFYRGLVLLVIACPCALVISTPVSIVAALAAAARNGVLVKGGVFIELPARLTAMAFDKTGTLTRGEPAVVDIVALNGHTENEVLEWAAALEAHSNHPLARAVGNLTRERELTPTAAADVTVLPGRGVRGRIDGRPFWLGSQRLLSERSDGAPDISGQVEALAQAGRTVVALGNDDHVCGLIAIADTVRPGAAEALAELRRRGLDHLVMLTGDNGATAHGVARQVGIDEVRAELLPEDKVRVVEELAIRHPAIAMVGDGVNDAPAMARAQVGIAMGAAGSDAAIETADIALMTDDLGRLGWLAGHSRRTLAVIRSNIAFSLAVKATFAGLAFAGLASLWGAIAADVGTSLLVVANALRLLRG